MNEFINYVFDFYGKNGVYAHFFTNPPTKAQIRAATLKLRKTSKEPIVFDSIDRERVRDILLTMHGQPLIGFLPNSK